jgi:ATP-binding cassette subfamily C protein
MTGKFFDSVTGKPKVMMQYCFLITGLAVCSTIFCYINKISNSMLLVDTSYEMSCNCIKKIHYAKLSKSSNLDPAYLSQRISQDAGCILGFTLNTIIQFLMNIIMILGVGFIMLRLSINVTICLVGVDCCYLLLYKLFRKALYKLSFELKEQQNLYFSKIQEQLASVRFVKVHSAQLFFKQRLNDTYKNFRKAFLKVQKCYNLYSGLDSITSSVSQLILFVAGGFLVLKDIFTVGDIVIFLGCAQKLMGAVSYFFRLGQTYQDAVVSYNRILEFQEWDIDEVGNLALFNIENINVYDLSFSYGEKKLYNNFSYCFKKGKVYGICGRNGTGKSTFLAILLGIECCGDKVFYDEHSISKYNLFSVRRDSIAVVEQEPKIIYDTIKNNLFLDNKIQDVELLCELLRRFDMSEYIEGLPGGLEFFVSPLTENISGGEKQKLAIIRALLKQSDILILDEPTSALDEKTVNSLMKYLMEIKHKTIIIIASHDERCFKFYDELIEI